MKRRYTSGTRGRAGKRRRTYARRGSRKAFKKTIYNKNLRNSIYFFRRNTSFATINGDNLNNPISNSYIFRLNDLPNFSEFQNLFDQYRISYVQLKFYLRLDPGAFAATSAVYPRIYWAPDYDDSATLTMAEMRQHFRMKEAALHPNRPIVMGIRPATLGLTYVSGVPGSLYSYAPKWKQWLDMGSPDIPHYCMKFNIQNMTDTNYRVDVEARYWIQCRGTR